MKYRTIAQMYIHDRLIEPGTEIGDDTGIPFRYSNGEPMIPNVAMVPADAEAEGIWKKKFPGQAVPEWDPSRQVPIVKPPEERDPNFAPVPPPPPAAKAPEAPKKEDVKPTPMTGSGPVVPKNEATPGPRDVKEPGKPDNAPVGQPANAPTPKADLSANPKKEG